MTGSTVASGAFLRSVIILSFSVGGRLVARKRGACCGVRHDVTARLHSDATEYS
jgi:hypothetical protein